VPFRAACSCMRSAALRELRRIRASARRSPPGVRSPAAFRCSVSSSARTPRCASASRRIPLALRSRARLPLELHLAVAEPSQEGVGRRFECDLLAIFLRAKRFREGVVLQRRPPRPPSARRFVGPGCSPLSDCLRTSCCRYEFRRRTHRWVIVGRTVSSDQREMTILSKCGFIYDVY
jgi:hypothetical protein